MTYRDWCPHCVDGEHHYHASEFGACIRTVVADRLGFTPAPFSEETEKLFEAGRAHENDLINRLRENDNLVTDNQREVEFLGIIGHLDGIVVDPLVPPSTPRVLEAKSPTSWATFQDAYKTNTWTDELAVRYSWQTSVYQHATRLECVVACLDDGRVKTFVIEQPIRSENEIYNRLCDIQNQVELGEVGLRMICEPSANPFFCVFSAVTGCRDKVIVAHPMLDEIVYRRTELQTEIARLQGDVKAADKDIALLIDEAPDESIRTAYCTVTRYPQAGPTTYDKAAMQADGVLEKYARPGKMSSRVKITVRGDNDVDT